MSHALQALRAIVLRELLKFGRQYGRLVSALVRPLLWILLILILWIFLILWLMHVCLFYVLM